MQPSDRDTIAAVLAGDRERFRVLVDRHSAALLAFLVRRTGEREEARELFQETWVRAFEGLAELRDGERLRAWLISIAHNVLRQKRRQLRPRELPDPEADVAELPLVAGVARGGGLESAEFVAAARAAIAALPPRQREVFELRAVQELDHAEIAALLGIREDNSRANFHQAVRTLRARLARHSP